MFGADEIIIDAKDNHIEQNIRSMVERFGGHFQIKTGISGLQVVKKWEGTIVHLTMYGESLEKAIPEIDPKKDLLIIVGAEKVPAEYYEYADVNVSVGNQPHSEISSLSVFLDRFLDGKELGWEFNHAKLKIVPQKHGKKVVSL